MTAQQKPAASLPMGAIGVNMLGTALLVGGIGGLAVPAVAQSIPAQAGIGDNPTSEELVGLMRDKLS